MRAALFSLALATTLIDTASLGSQALADEPLCAPRTRILAALAAKFQEAPIALGIDNRGVLVELLTSKDGTTWTLLASGPDGTTCVVAAGQDWTPAAAEPSGPAL